MVIIQHPAHYYFDWQVKDDYQYSDFGQQEERYGYDTKGRFGTSYSGYDGGIGGFQKIEYVVEAKPMQVNSYSHGGHSNYKSSY